MDFSLSSTLIIMNIAYVLNLIGLAVKNILILRILLISAQGILVYTGYVQGNPIVVFWNIVFFIINLYRTIMLLLERRPVKLPEDLEDLYRENFYYMTDREFLRFWKLGKSMELSRETVIKTGEVPDSVYIITGGKAMVKNDTGIVAVLRRGGFIGEMSYVTDRPPAADVLAGEALSLQLWKRADLNRLKKREHALWVKMQQALGHDLVVKVSNMSHQKTESLKGLLEKAEEAADRPEEDNS